MEDVTAPKQSKVGEPFRRRRPQASSPGSSSQAGLLSAART